MVSQPQTTYPDVASMPPARHFPHVALSPPSPQTSNGNGQSNGRAGRKPRRRLMIRFWLNDFNPVDSAIGQHLDALRSARKMTGFIRDALLLAMDLAKGNTEELRRQYSGIVADLEAPPPPKEAATTERLAVALEALPAIFEHVLAKGSHTSATPVKAANGHSAPPTPNPDMPSIFGAKSVQDCAVAASEARANFSAGMGDLFGGADDCFDD